MNSQSFKAILIITLSALFAIYLGVSAATAQYEAIGWVVAGLMVAFILALGKSIWTLIPVSAVLVGTINALPGSPPAWALASVVVCTIYILRFAMRKVDVVFRFDIVDFAMLLQVIAVGQAFARAPAGVMFLGGDSAGGKSYIIFGCAFVSYFLLSITNAEMKTVRATVITMISVCVLDGFIALLGDYSGAFAAAILHIYSNSNLDLAMSGGSLRDMTVNRAGVGFSQLGKAMVIPCLCLTRPLNMFNLLKPWFPFLAASGAILVMLSGFRSFMGYLVVIYIVSAFVRKRVVDIVLVGFAGLICLGLIVISGQVREMPFGVQRILSVLPVDVTAAARADAEDSTTWRVEMWELALTTDRYIKNKFLGDGFGISSHEMAAKLNAELGIGEFNIQDQMLATGSYHGFHVETIRFTGVFGLLCAIFAMVVFFRKALQILSFYRGRPEFNYLAYLLIPFLIYPWWSLLVFGAYRAEFPQFLVLAGMLKVVDRIRQREIVAQKDMEALTEEPARSNTPAPRFAGGDGRPRPALGFGRQPG